MAFINNEKRIIWKIIKQSRWRLAGRSVHEMARIIFDALAVANFFNHFQIKHGSLVNSLCFDEKILALKVGHPFNQFFSDIFHGLIQEVFWGRVMAGWINGDAV